MIQIQAYVALPSAPRAALITGAIDENPLNVAEEFRIGDQITLACAEGAAYPWRAQEATTRPQTDP
jgi:hypothetical protein